MALLPFKKLTLIAHTRDEERILTLLSRTGSVEVTATSEIERCAKGDASERAELIRSRAAELSFCFDFWRAERVKLDKALRRQEKTGEHLTDYFPVKVSLLDKIRAGKPDVSFDEFDRVAEDSDAVWQAAKRLREISAEEAELRGEQTRGAALAEQLSFYEKCDLPFDAVRGGRHVEILLGTAPTDLLKAADFSDLPALSVTEIDCRRRVSTLLVAYPLEQKELCADRLSAISFAKCGFDFPMTATEKVAELKARTAEIDRRFIALAEEAVERPARHGEGVCEL